MVAEMFPQTLCPSGFQGSLDALAMVAAQRPRPAGPPGCSLQPPSLRAPCLTLTKLPLADICPGGPSKNEFWVFHYFLEEQRCYWASVIGAGSGSLSFLGAEGFFLYLILFPWRGATNLGLSLVDGSPWGDSLPSGQPISAKQATPAMLGCKAGP